MHSTERNHHLSYHTYTMRQLKITQSITNRASAALDKYLVEIGREELISTDEKGNSPSVSVRETKKRWKNWYALTFVS